MDRHLVDTTADVTTNFETFIRMRDSTKQVEREEYKAYLRKAKVLVVEKINGKREYAPSRFVGYRRNSLKAHQAEHRDGTATNLRLEEIYQNWVFDAVESERFVRFCKQHGIERPTAHLNTPLKFIFSSAYSPSTAATRFNSKSTAEASDSEDHGKKGHYDNPMIPFPLNQILYGPPGTGKTHHTKTRAVGIIEGLTDELVTQTYTRNEVRSRFENYRYTGQIEFITFHQAFSYEDFVEGIKPLKPTDGEPVRYAIEDGILKRLCAAADANRNAAPATPTAALQKTADFDELFDSFVNKLTPMLAKGREMEVTMATGRRITVYRIDKNIIWYRFTDAKNHHITRNGLRPYFEHYITGTEDKPNLPKFAVSAKQALVAALLRKNASVSKREQISPSPRQYSSRFVLIIDEINRGNVANIFGELITLLEDDKRAGRPEALTVKLPYSKEDFRVPDNLYLLGTMNTADRSVEALDTALRRRFSFTEMQPEAQVIRAQVGENGVVEGIDVALILEALNSRLEQLLDRDHCLGHALLLRIQTLEDLRAAFQRNILPLLQEYFFGDWGKIGLVLGPQFVEVSKPGAPGRFALAKLPGYDATGLHDKRLYRLADLATLGPEAFRSIYATT